MSELDRDIQAAIAVVLSFVSRMNDWETRRFYRSRVDHGFEFPAKRDSRLAGDLSAEELDAQYYVLFEQHCIKRKRGYGGFPSSYSAGGKYVGISRETVTEANRSGPGRIEVVCTGGQFPDQQYKFVLLKKGDKWLIDNVLTGSVGDDWMRAYLRDTEPIRVRLAWRAGARNHRRWAGRGFWPVPQGHVRTTGYRQ